jgi:DNA-binding NarL/FixJ family response regulator
MDMRCLIVDDNVSFRRAMRYMLERDGARVLGMASNGSEALEHAERLRPGIVLVDVRLGDESGFDVAHRLQEHFTEDWRPVIILVSSHAEDELAGRMEASPSLRFLEKTAVSVDRISELLSTRPGANWR